MVGREGRNLILIDQQENGKRRSGHRRPRMIRKGTKAENVEKMREARERGKTECGKPKKTGGRQSRRGEGNRKESEEG